MAMKVTKTAIHRLSVDMSCGCRMYAEFNDAQCKESVDGAEELTKVFLPCEKHSTDSAVSMLEFIVSERLDEAVEQAQKAPVHLHAIPQFIEEGDSGGVTAQGDSVQSVQKINRPAAVTRGRPEKPPGVKTIQRSPEQLAKAGAAPFRHQGNMTDVQMGDGVDEDENTTIDIEAALDMLDSKESGIVNDEDDE